MRNTIQYRYTLFYSISANLQCQATAICAKYLIFRRLLKYMIRRTNRIFKPSADHLRTVNLEVTTSWLRYERRSSNNVHGNVNVCTSYPKVIAMMVMSKPKKASSFLRPAEREYGALLFISIHEAATYFCVIWWCKETVRRKTTYRTCLRRGRRTCRWWWWGRRPTRGSCQQTHR